MATASPSHAALMDEVYRGQRHIYDLTRKYYLFGRDTLIAGLDARAGMPVLEVACGTGRNLAKVGKAWPGVRLFGLDISAEMLKSARAAVGAEARLGEGDACSFDPQYLLGEPAFERIVLSYSLSMIPDWEGALDHAAGLLAGRRIASRGRFWRPSGPARPLPDPASEVAGEVSRGASEQFACCGCPHCPFARFAARKPARAARILPASRAERLIGVRIAG